MIHELKVWPTFFRDMLAGDKTFEVRKNDRGFNVGDELILREWDPQAQRYTGATTRRRVHYLTRLDLIGCPGFVAMGLANVDLPYRGGGFR